MLLRYFLLLSVSQSFLGKQTKVSAAAKVLPHKIDLNLDYDLFPLRATHEAAVIEWGNSAIISALDAAVASFGPQTSRGAFFEVETAPVLANPIDGRGSRSSIPTEEPIDGVSVSYPGPLKNKDEVDGNLVIMTNDAKMSGVTMARIAKESGAAALMIVNTDSEYPDFIYSLHALNEEEEDYAEEHIDIPVIMVSLASGNLITQATVEEGMKDEDIVNNGLPERVRLYGAGDRPFFEDVVSNNPVLYLIHNLMSPTECETLIKSAEGKMDLVDDTVSNILEHTVPSSDMKPKAINIEKVQLWKGQLNSHLGKQIEERIEQVTGYPQDQFSDWQISKYVKGSRYDLHYDQTPSQKQFYPPLATITVFLNDIEEDIGGEVVFPYPKEGNPIMIQPKEGLAFVHHTSDYEGKFDDAAVYGDIELGGDGTTVKYIAKKFVYGTPLPPSRRVILPILALPFGGKLPRFVISAHDFMIDTFGDDGYFYFDKAVVVCLGLFVVALVSIVGFLFKDAIMGNDAPPKSKKE